MGTTQQKNKKTNHGKNIERICNILDISNEQLAKMLNVDIETFQNYIETEILGDNIIKNIADKLDIHPDIIKKLGEDNTTVNIQNNYEGSNSNAFQVAMQSHTFIHNPYEKIIELYERLLQAKEEQIILLDKKLKEAK